MAYITPIYDRTFSDVQTKNSKAYLNLADWQRIDNNTQETVFAINAALGESLTLVTVATMTTASIPDTDELNDLAGNVETIRVYFDGIITDSDFTEVKDDYINGAKINFITTNQWEKVLDIMYQIYKSPYSPDRIPVTGVAICGADLLRNSLIR